MKSLIILGMFLSVLSLSGCHQSIAKETAEEMLGLTLASVNECIDILDNELEPIIVYSTKPCFVQKHGIFGIEWNDIFVRGGIHKKTGITVYSISVIAYAKQWQYPYQLNYKFNEDLILSEAHRVDSDVSCSSRGDCTHREIVSFDIRADYLADLSAKYDDLGDNPEDKVTIFRMQNRNTKNTDWVLNTAELVGLYRAVEGIR